MDIKKQIESTQLLLNNSPVEDFLGLSSSEMHTLLYNLFEEKSILKIKHPVSESTLSQIPFFLLCEEFLKILFREGKPLKLTPTGRLPRKICKELYLKDLYLITPLKKEYLNYMMRKK